MTKVRVHELAKELGMENKELVDLLQKKNVDVKNHMSTLEEDVASQIRKERAGQAEKKEEKPEGENAAQGADKADGAPKKKNLAYVIRPQNSRNTSVQTADSMLVAYQNGSKITCTNNRGATPSTMAAAIDVLAVKAMVAPSRCQCGPPRQPP